MEVQGYKLKINAILMHESLQIGGAFIVQNLEERAENAVTEVGAGDLLGTSEFLCAA